MKNRTVEYCTYCNLNIVDICKLKVRFNLFLNFNYHRAHLCGLENKPQFNQTIHIFLLLHCIVLFVQAMLFYIRGKHIRPIRTYVSDG